MNYEKTIITAIALVLALGVTFGLIASGIAQGTHGDQYTLLNEEPNTVTVEAVSIQPDSEYRVLAEGSNLSVWNQLTSTFAFEAYTIDEHQDDVLDIQFSPEGDLLLSTGADENWVLYDSSDGSSISHLNTESESDDVTTGHFAGGNNFSIITRDTAILIDNISTPTNPVFHTSSIRFSDDPIVSADISEDQSTYAIGDNGGDIEVYNVTVGEMDPLSTTHTVDNLGDPVESVAVHPNGDYVAAGTQQFDDTIYIFDITGASANQVASISDPSASIRTLDWHPDGDHLLATTGPDARMYDVSDPSNPVLDATLTDSDDTLYSGEFSPDWDRLFTGALDGENYWYETGLTPSLSVNGPTEVNISEEIQLTASFGGEDVSSEATWQSNNTTRATVDGDGTVSGLDGGDVNISVQYNGDEVGHEIEVLNPVVGTQLEFVFNTPKPPNQLANDIWKVRDDFSIRPVYEYADGTTEYVDWLAMSGKTSQFNGAYVNEVNLEGGLGPRFQLIDNRTAVSTEIDFGWVDDGTEYNVTHSMDEITHRLVQSISMEPEGDGEVLSGTIENPEINVTFFDGFYIEAPFSNDPGNLGTDQIGYTFTNPNLVTELGGGNLNWLNPGEVTATVTFEDGPNDVNVSAAQSYTIFGDMDPVMNRTWDHPDVLTTGEPYEYSASVQFEGPNGEFGNERDVTSEIEPYQGDWGDVILDAENGTIEFNESGTYELYFLYQDSRGQEAYGQITQAVAEGVEGDWTIELDAPMADGQAENSHDNPYEVQLGEPYGVDISLAGQDIDLNEFHAGETEWLLVTYFNDIDGLVGGVTDPYTFDIAQATSGDNVTYDPDDETVTFHDEVQRYRIEASRNDYPQAGQILTDEAFVRIDPEPALNEDSWGVLSVYDRLIGALTNWVVVGLLMVIAAVGVVGSVAGTGPALGIGIMGIILGWAMGLFPMYILLVALGFGLFAVATRGRGEF